MINKVTLARGVEKQLRKVPKHIVIKLMGWIDDVEKRGLEEARKVLGYHDEPLAGKLRGKRSIRLNRQWRATYEVKTTAGQMMIEFVEVQEVHPHDY